MHILLFRFSELKKFVDTESINSAAFATKTASKKLLKTLLGAVKASFKKKLKISLGRSESLTGKLERYVFIIDSLEAKAREK